MYSTQTSLLYAGITGIAWIAYQSITGKFVYRRKIIWREDNPVHFWLAMSFESLLAIASLTWGLGFKTLAVVLSGVVELTALILALWFVGSATKLRWTERRLKR